MASHKVHKKRLSLQIEALNRIGNSSQQRIHPEFQKVVCESGHSAGSGGANDARSSQHIAKCLSRYNRLPINSTDDSPRDWQSSFADQHDSFSHPPPLPAKRNTKSRVSSQPSRSCPRSSEDDAPLWAARCSEPFREPDYGPPSQFKPYGPLTSRDVRDGEHVKAASSVETKESTKKKYDRSFSDDDADSSDSCIVNVVEAFNSELITCPEDKGIKRTCKSVYREETFGELIKGRSLPDISLLSLKADGQVSSSHLEQYEPRPRILVTDESDFTRKFEDECNSSDSVDCNDDSNDHQSDSKDYRLVRKTRKTGSEYSREMLKYSLGVPSAQSTIQRTRQKDKYNNESASSSTQPSSDSPEDKALKFVQRSTSNASSFSDQMKVQRRRWDLNLPSRSHSFNLNKEPSHHVIHDTVQLRKPRQTATGTNDWWRKQLTPAKSLPNLKSDIPEPAPRKARTTRVVRKVYKSESVHNTRKMKVGTILISLLNLNHRNIFSLIGLASIGLLGTGKNMSTLQW